MKKPRLLVGTVAKLAYGRLLTGDSSWNFPWSPSTSFPCDWILGAKSTIWNEYVYRRHTFVWGTGVCYKKHFLLLLSFLCLTAHFFLVEGNPLFFIHSILGLFWIHIAVKSVIIGHHCISKTLKRVVLANPISTEKQSPLSALTSSHTA